MLVHDALLEHLKLIDAEEERQAQARLAIAVNAETMRQQFIDALRERIELQYELEIVDEDLAQWKVTKMSHGAAVASAIVAAADGDRYEMRWNLAEGNVLLALNATTDEIMPGPDSISISWSAYHNESRWTVAFDSLVRALVYAKTGKSL